MLVMKKGTVSQSDGIRLPDDEVIKSIHEENIYKYRGIFQLDKVMCDAMKEKLGTEYKRRVKMVLTSKLNGGNMMAAINS